MQLLLLCLRPKPDAVACQKIQELVRSPLDWIQLMEIAIAHAVLPLLCKGLMATRVEGIDKPLYRIKAQCRFNTIRNFRLTQELQRVLNLLAAHDIAAVPFKGPTLAAIAYGDISLRQFSDLDILIHERDFLKTRDLLLGDRYYRAKEISFSDDIDQQEMDLMRSQGEYPFQKQNSAISIDVHCRLMTGKLPISSAKLDGFWDNLSPVSLLNYQVQTFNAEDLILYLCAHGSKDFWKKLIWICDIAYLIDRHPDINWERLIRRARSLACEQMLWLGLSLVKDALEVSFPAAVEQERQVAFRKQSLSLQIQQRLRSGVLPQNVRHFYLSRFYFYAQMQGNWKEKVRYCQTYGLLLLNQWRLSQLSRLGG